MNFIEFSLVCEDFHDFSSKSYGQYWNFWFACARLLASRANVYLFHQKHPGNEEISSREVPSIFCFSPTRKIRDVVTFFVLMSECKKVGFFLEIPSNFLDSRNSVRESAQLEYWNWAFWLFLDLSNLLITNHKLFPICWIILSIKSPPNMVENSWGWILTRLESWGWIHGGEFLFF